MCVQHLLVSFIQICRFFGQMFQFPIPCVASAKSVAVEFLHQNHIGYLVFVQFIEVHVVDVCIDQIITENGIAWLQQMSKMCFGVDCIIVDSQLGRFDHPNVGDDVLL